MTSDRSHAQSNTMLEAKDNSDANQSYQATTVDHIETLKADFDPKSKRPFDEKCESDCSDKPSNVQAQTHKSVKSTTVDQSSSDLQGQSIQRLSNELSKSKRDLESMVIRYAKSESDNLQNKNKIEDLEKKLKRAIKDNDSLANRVKILTNDKNHLSETLSAKLAQLTVLEQKSCSLSNDQTNKVIELESKVMELEGNNEELRKHIETYKSKEADLLDFSERLSMKQMLLQTELDKALENVPDYKGQCENLQSLNTELNERVDDLLHQLSIANGNLDAMRTANDRLTEGRYQLEIKCRRRIEELENEVKLVKRKCQIATKELLKRIRQYEPEIST